MAANEFSTISDIELLAHFAELERLFSEALGDFVALASVRCEIVARMDIVTNELARRGVPIPEEEI